MSVLAPELTLEVDSPRHPSPLPPCLLSFPDPAAAPISGLVAAGGDLEPQTIVEAYRNGIFPWPHDGMDLLWWSSEPRAILPVEPVLVSRRLARTLKQSHFGVSLDRAFGDVMRGCQVREEGTWITPAMLEAYQELHRRGWAHSIEVWTGQGDLAGGLYGVAVGGLFGAESMFHVVTDASKVAMVALRQYARAVGTQLLDVQMQTAHLETMGAVTIPRHEYLARVSAAIDLPVTFGAP